MPVADQRLANAIQVRRDVNLSQDGFELIKRLLKAQISALGSHEYLRSRFRRTLERQYLTLNDAFKSIDLKERGFVSGYDIQDLLMAESSPGTTTPTEIANQVELLLSIYDKKGTSRGITQWSFIENLTPVPVSSEMPAGPINAAE